MAKIVYSPDRKIIGRATGQLLDLTIIEEPVSIGGTRTPFASNDLTYDSVEGGTILQHASVYAEALLDSANLSLDSDDENVTLGAGNRMLDQGAGGVASVFVRRYGYSAQRIRRSYVSPPATINDSTGYAVGTLGEHILDAIIAMIGVQEQSNTIQQYITYSNWDINSPIVTLNPNIFTGGLDFSATSVMRSDQPNDRYAPALVTNRHAIVARHTAPAIGAEILFRRANGTFQKVSVSAKQNVTPPVGASSQAAWDLTVLYLDAEVTGITPYKTMPVDWIDTYTPSSIQGAPSQGIIPVIRKAMHSSIDDITGSFILINTLRFIEASWPVLWNTRGVIQTGEVPEAWGKGNSIPGDSGSPSFLFINGEPVLLTSQYGVSATTDIAYYTTEINSIMDTLASAAPGTYTLTHPDLSGFTTYP